MKALLIRVFLATLYLGVVLYVALAVWGASVGAALIPDGGYRVGLGASLIAFNLVFLLLTPKIVRRLRKLRAELARVPQSKLPLVPESESA